VPLPGIVADEGEPELGALEVGELDLDGSLEELGAVELDELDLDGSVEELPAAGALPLGVVCVPWAAATLARLRAKTTATNKLRNCRITSHLLLNV
jgi:hypothetical protein